MEKINFENATLKTQAYVTVGDTNYNVIDSVYEGGTDLDAETLNYAFQLMHPVGSIYMTTVASNPADVFGFGTWELWGAGRVPVGIDTEQDEFNEVEKTGGEKEVTLTIDKIPEHQHGEYIEYGGGKQPYTLASGGGTSKSGYFLNAQTTAYSGPQVLTEKTGGGQSHNNLQPYITCYMFKRIS